MCGISAIRRYRQFSLRQSGLFLLVNFVPGQDFLALQPWRPAVPKPAGIGGTGQHGQSVPLEGSTPRQAGAPQCASRPDPLFLA
jgi:hypothetical protein